MSESPRNLFNALFDFRPREGFSPAENYLSEAFAYALETCDGACDTWLSLALGRKVHAIRFEEFQGIEWLPKRGHLAET